MAAAGSILVFRAEEILMTLISVATQEISQAWGVKGELKKLQNTLNTIQSLLHDAENQQVEKEAVKRWLRRLKSVAYDADDLLDEFKYESLRHKMEIQNRMTLKGQVRYFFSHTNPFAFRLKIAHKLKDINEVLDGIRNDAIGFNLKVESSSADSTSMMNNKDRQTFSLIDDKEVFGRNGEQSKLVGMLVKTTSSIKSDDQIISVFPIVGMGGLGKTTLAQLVYKDSLTVKHFDLRMWVCVSEPFEVHRLLKEITETAGGGECNASNLNLIATSLQERLKGKRFLLVLDDVWSEDHFVEKWDTLIVPLKSGSVGSKVIVTTRSHEVAKMMTPNYIHPLGTLSEQECWSLFSRRAFSQGGPQETPNLVEIGRRIINKCGGVPLAVKVLGSLMHFKTEEREWLSMEREFLNLLQDRNVEKNKYGDTERCKMHDLVHDLAQVVGKLDYSTVEFNNVEQISDEARGLLLFSDCFERLIEIPKALEKAKKLRTLLISLPSIPASLVSNIEMLMKFQSLRVVDVRNWKMKKMLKLNYCSDLRELPKEMRKMVNLRHFEMVICNA
ncbi:putative disease resistance protein RGA3 [Telopea speciosissima]|uniref:putative disease resistance protein RGA3 n=1 Tax=Telopea speciosissima TaxID=54955 RepID=UPI001CC6E20B|nr:putative disease resistance protein RGA3 [Telopea speciosissima]